MQVCSWLFRNTFVLVGFCIILTGEMVPANSQLKRIRPLTPWMPLSVSHSKSTRLLDQSTNSLGCPSVPSAPVKLQREHWILMPPSGVGKGLRGLMRRGVWPCHWGDECLPSTVLGTDDGKSPSQYIVSICLIWSKFLFVSCVRCVSHDVCFQKYVTDWPECSLNQDYNAHSVVSCPQVKNPVVIFRAKWRKSR